MAGTRTAGIDWASEAHEVCVSEEGRMNERFSATHDERGITALAGKLLRLGVCRVAIERPDGILVERLLAAGLEVLAIHPNQVKAARARFAVAHGKSDRFDAYVLAELARAGARRCHHPRQRHPRRYRLARGSDRRPRTPRRRTFRVGGWLENPELF